MTTVLSKLNWLIRDDVSTVHPYLRLRIWLSKAVNPRIHCALWKVLVLAAAHFEWCERSRAHQAKKQVSNLVLDSCHKQKAFCKVTFVRLTEVTVLVKPHFVSWSCLPPCYCRGPGLIPVQSVWGLWGSKLHWYKFLSVYVNFPLLVSLLQCSVHINSAIINAV